ncbi:glycine C-acetyltransferase, partial [Escherichia sp. SS-MK2]
MRGEFYQQLTNDLETARAEGLFKEERIITSAKFRINNVHQSHFWRM